MRRLFVTTVALAIIGTCLTIAEPVAGGFTTPCVDRPTRPSGTTTVNITHAGRPRSFRLHIPDGYFPTNRMPLVLNFHGAGWTADEQLEYSEYISFADQNGIVVAAPNADRALGYWAPWNRTVDDVGFVDKILDRVRADLCIDGDRMFATGMSSGGIMSSYLACRLARRIAAVVTVAGTIQPNNCRPSRPVPVMAFHGSHDRVIRFEGGGTVTGIPVPPIRSELRLWALRNGCADASTVARLAPDVVQRKWRCTGDRMVKLVRIEGGGHTWPGASRQVQGLGRTTQSIDATRAGWSFFVNHPRA
jgi:polyhydroxybutyrate depolymerase